MKCDLFYSEGSLQDLDLVGGVDGLGAVVDAQLGVDRLDVRAHRVQRDDQPFGDLFILEPLRHQAQHVQLAGGERSQQPACRSLRRPASPQPAGRAGTPIGYGGQSASEPG